MVVVIRWCLLFGTLINDHLMYTGCNFCAIRKSEMAVNIEIIKIFGLFLRVPYMNRYQYLFICFIHIGILCQVSRHLILIDFVLFQSHLLGIFENVNEVEFHVKDYDRMIAVLSRENERIAVRFKK